MSADVEELRRMAADARQEADELRGTAAALRRARRVDFVSRAADRYRDELERQARRAEQVAEELMEASRALLDHAHQVEERLRQIESVERWFGDRIRDARRVLSSAVDGADSAVDAARQEAQRLVNAAGRAPSSGSPDWLDFARRLGR